jgi:hypothetical protein
MNSTSDDIQSEKKKETAPSPVARCIVLARGSHVTGVLLAAIVYWFKYARKTLPKSKGYWIANKRTWWMREASSAMVVRESKYLVRKTHTDRMRDHEP